MTDWSTNEYRKKHNLYGGVGYYRIVAPYQELQKAYPDKYKIDIYNRELSDLSKNKKAEEFWVDFVQKYDIIVTKAIDNPQAAAQISFFCNRFGKKLVLDLDDNYFEVKPDQPAYKYYHPGSQKRSFFGAYLSMVDAVIVSTEPLAKYYKEKIKKTHGIDKPIFTFHNFNRIEEWNFKPVKKDNKKVVIGWAGSTTHDEDLKLVMPPINDLMSKYDNLYLELVGGLTTETAPKVLSYFDSKNIDRVSVKGGTNAWKGYPELMSKQKWDIGIAPLIDDEFNRGKSHIKWLEYACYGIPCVASKTYPYFREIDDRLTIINGETGYLAIDGLDFKRKLRLLIEDKEERELIGKNAKKYVVDNLQYKDNIYKLDKIIENIWSIQTQPIKME